MKKITLLIFFILIITACSIEDDDSTNFYFEISTIQSIDIPSEFELGETYSITVNYLNPSTCHTFSDLYYYKDTNEPTIAIINSVHDKKDCEVLENEIIEYTFNFIVNSNGFTPLNSGRVKMDKTKTNF